MHLHVELHRMRLSVVLPCYNEEQNIAVTVQDLVSWFAREGIEGEIVAVDDGSADGTWSVLERLKSQTPGMKLKRHERNFGYGSALRSGCDAATMEFMGYMDSDGQFKAEDWSALLPFLQEYDCVTGRRVGRADPFFRRVNALLFTLLTFVILGLWVRDINCAMKVWRTALWPRIRPTRSTGALFNAELFYRLRLAGIRWKQVPVHHYPRRHGVQTGAHLRVIFRMFRDLVRLRLGR